MLRHPQHERKKCCNDSRLIPFALSLSKGKRRVVEHPVMTHTPVALFLTIVLFCGVALAQDLTKAKQEEHILGDVVAISGIQSGILKEKGALDRYQSKEAVYFPTEWRDPDGYGVGLHQTIYVIGYNSKLVPADAVPKGYEDLLNPRWKRQLAWDPEEYYLFGALMKARGKEKGLEFWHRFAE